MAATPPPEDDGKTPGEDTPDRHPPGENGPGEDPPGEDAWDDVELDMDFIRSAETAEPSARARMLAARWRDRGAPQPQPWRSDEPPAGWFFSRARKRRRRRR